MMTPDTREYVGTKPVLATPMTRMAYNMYRGWALPANEDPSDNGFLVEHFEANTPNHEDHLGYISWLPADVFHSLYQPASKKAVMTREQVDAALASKEWAGKRITPEMLEQEIVSEGYHVFPGTTLTICILVLKNGFVLTGESACAVPANFDAEIGKGIARANAKQKIWAHLGFRLRDQIYFTDPISQL